MTSRWQLTPRALDDLDGIWQYIAQDNAAAADRVEAAILAACDRLARYPLLGARRLELTLLPLRFWTLPKYPNFIVVYRPETRPLQVIAILHGSRDLAQVLEEAS
jgi:plasmid stabilization system protein ParE